MSSYTIYNFGCIRCIQCKKCLALCMDNYRRYSPYMEKCTFCRIDPQENKNLSNNIDDDSSDSGPGGIVWPGFPSKHFEEVDVDNILANQSPIRKTVYKSTPFVSDYDEYIQTENWLSLWDNKYTRPFFIRCLDEAADLKSRLDNFLRIENEINQILQSIRTNAKIIYFSSKKIRHRNIKYHQTAIFDCEPIAIAKSVPFHYYVLLTRSDAAETDEWFPDDHMCMSYSKNITVFWSQKIPSPIHDAIQHDYHKIRINLIQLVCSIDKIYDDQFPTEIIEILVQYYRHAIIYFEVNSRIKTIISFDTTPSLITESGLSSVCSIL